VAKAVNERSPERVAWHFIAADEAATRLQASYDEGLAAGEVLDRRALHGENRITQKPGKGALLRFALQFVQPLVLVLLVAGVVTAVLGEWVDSGVIFGVTLINAVIGFIQEGRAEDALAALARSVSSEVTVLRDGCKQRLPSTELVPGDVVLLAAGDKVPADLRLFRAKDLQAIESALTGESTAVAKHGEVLPEATVLADRCNMAYAGTVMITGRGAGVVVATGDRTETGRISQLIAEAPDLTTPLTRKMAVFSNWLLIAIGLLAVLTFIVGMWRGSSAFEMFMAAVALAVGAIPEGLPAAMTITLAIGVARMAKRRAIIRKLPAVETLGSTTIICSDKTGTLTENQMTVRELYAGGVQTTVSGSGYAPEGKVGDGAEIAGALRECLLAGVLCNDAALSEDDTGSEGKDLREHGEQWTIVGDPTEGALIVVARKSVSTRRRCTRASRAATKSLSIRRVSTWPRHTKSKASAWRTSKELSNSCCRARNRCSTPPDSRWRCAPRRSRRSRTPRAPWPRKACAFWRSPASPPPRTRCQLSTSTAPMPAWSSSAWSE
jgi:cation-transporting ATPase F